MTVSIIFRVNIIILMSESNLFNIGHHIIVSSHELADLKAFSCIKSVRHGIWKEYECNGWWKYFDLLDINVGEKHNLCLFCHIKNLNRITLNTERDILRNSQAIFFCILNSFFVSLAVKESCSILWILLKRVEKNCASNALWWGSCYQRRLFLGLSYCIWYSFWDWKNQKEYIVNPDLFFDLFDHRWRKKSLYWDKERCPGWFWWDWIWLYEFNKIGLCDEDEKRSIDECVILIEGDLCFRDILKDLGCNEIEPNGITLVVELLKILFKPQVFDKP